MKICVLQPDYTGSPVDYGNYDPQRNLAPWLPGHQVDHLFLRKSTSFAQLLKAATQPYDIYINLCEGYPEWDIPGFDVIWALERLNLPFTGTTMRNFLHSKETMKVVAHTSGVATPAWLVARTLSDLDNMPATLRYPLFVKPADSGDSLGIDELSLIQDKQQLQTCCAKLLPEFNKLLIEQYIDGREFTVLIAAGPDGPIAFTPLEFVFNHDEQFKTYKMKITESHAASNVPVTDSTLSTDLRDMAIKIFRAFDAESYARIDIRSNQAGEIFFLEINCECSIFYAEGSEGSADYILNHEPIGHEGFLKLIIADGIRRHRQRQKPYEARLGPDGVFGCFANRDLAQGETVPAGSFRQSPTGNLQNLVTQRSISKGEELLSAAHSSGVN